MNPILRWLIINKARELGKTNKEVAMILSVLAWILKNTGLIVGIVEALIKAAVGIVNITKTTRDDAALETVKRVFNSVQKWLYQNSALLAKLAAGTTDKTKK